MKNLIVEEKYNNKKLNTYLLETFKGLSLNTLYKALRKKDIRINDKRISENLIIHTGDKITVYISDELLTSNNSNNIKESALKTSVFSNIVYEDNNILLVNKPSEIETVSPNSSDVTLTTILSEKYSFISPCHRLDRNTTGLVVFAKNEESLSILFDKFRNREIEKIYNCVVDGILPKKQDTLESYLFKDTKKSKVYISDIKKDKYQKIVTSYKVLKENKEKDISLLEVLLHTGKTHQIRAHLSHIGHPILGDGKYGRNEINTKFKAKVQMLCSCKLCFNFSSPSGILEYLNGKSFEIESNFISTFKF